MATVIPPPPKRVKIAPSANTIDRSAAAPTIIAQFRNSLDGTLLGPPLSLPADTTREGLELLVNNLRGSVRSLPALFEKNTHLRFYLRRPLIRYRLRSIQICRLRLHRLPMERNRKMLLA